jgi:hypothetical protein
MAHGIMPLYTPLAGSGLNMAESIQRLLADRALSGQHPSSSQQIIDGLEATARGGIAPPPRLCGAASARPVGSGLANDATPWVAQERARSVEYPVITLPNQKGYVHDK